MNVEFKTGSAVDPGGIQADPLPLAVACLRLPFAAAAVAREDPVAPR